MYYNSVNLYMYKQTQETSHYTATVMNNELKNVANILH